MKGFKENIMENNDCLNYARNSKGYNPSNLNWDFRGYLYWKNCDCIIYDDQYN